MVQDNCCATLEIQSKLPTADLTADVEMLQLKEAQNVLLRRHEERRKSHFVAVEDG